MEQKKTLWIIAAVGTFLLVVLGTAGILYSPAKNPGPTVAAVSTKNDNKDEGWTSSSSTEVSPIPVPSQTDTSSSQKVNEMVVLSGNTTVYDINGNKKQDETTIDLNSLKSGMITQNPMPQTPDININVNVPDYNKEIKKDVEVPLKADIKADKDNKKEAVAENKDNINKNVNKTEKKETHVPAVVPPAPVKKKSTQPPVTVKKTVTAPAAIPPSKPEPKKVTQYWVQVASYSNKKGAENARDILASNRLNPDIFTHRDDKDNLYYRVRIGPYTTKSEAEYWKAKILSISEFEGNDSYITSTIK